MDKTKIIPIVLLVVILGIGFVAFTFYGDNQNLKNANTRLEDDNQNLVKDFNTLKNRYTSVEKAKSSAERKLSMIKEELSRLEEEKTSLRGKLIKVSRERDLLIEKSKKTSRMNIQTIASPQPAQTQGFSSDEHWAEFVQQKASLEAKVGVLNKALFDEKSKIARLSKENKEFSLKVDGLSKEKERLTEEIRFKERTLRIMSMDLVSEREAKGAASNEVKRLRNENVTLKRELILTNKEQLKIQDKFKQAVEKKNALERKIINTESILKEKFLVFEQLQEQLKSTILEGKSITADETVSVELPPIIVKPSTSGIKGLQGEVIAVNSEEDFIVIDIGEGSGMRPGALLKIMRGDKEVATVEVIETRKEISAANIKETIGGLSIQEGDIAVSK